ncbi:MAG: HlyD family efflux transporter periplasmic adaptor subunit [Candidatus Avoscillospira sp.]
MKQGKFYTKLVLWIFLAAVVCYFGYYIFSAVYAPLTTTAAIEYEAGTGSYTTGYVVRDETVLTSRYDITTLVVSEGERVSKNQTVATGYLNADAQERQLQIAELESQLEQLQYAASYSADAADQALLDAEIQAQLANMSRNVARRDLNAASDSSAALKGLILRRMSAAGEGEEDDLSQRISDLQQEIASLNTVASIDTTVVAAEHSGYFSGTVDGYENVLTVEALSEMSIESLENLQPAELAGNEVGKIISGDTWYYVTVVPADQLQGVTVGDKVPVTFSSQFYNSLTMTIYRMGKEQDGSRLLVLSCNYYMQDVTLLRQQSADVVFTSYAGLRVPKEAIRVNENSQAGVYVLEGNAAVWKNVNILHDNGESYVVELDKSSTDNLWPGDEIIVGAKNLYDGKVVR